jgi:hypothetical protein
MNLKVQDSRVVAGFKLLAIPPLASREIRRRSRFTTWMRTIFVLATTTFLMLAAGATAVLLNIG